MARKGILRSSCHSAGKLTAQIVLSFFAISPALLPSTQASIVRDSVQAPFIISPDPIDQSRKLNRDGSLPTFDLEPRHIFHHGARKYPDLHRRLDLPSEAGHLWIQEEGSSDIRPAAPVRVRSNPINIQRLADRTPERMNALLESGRQRGHEVPLPASDWVIEDIPGPNITDKETVLSLARVALDAYILEPHTGDWQDVGGGFNYTEDFGWESDGLRGHIFADTKNKTVIIGLKGTSPAVFDGDETTTNDKENDNLFFSCCCGQGGQFWWRPVCDCQTGAYSCNSTCLEKSLMKKDRYWHASQDLYHNVTALYPEAEIWLVGHSLGGALSSLLGLFFGHPAVTFEAVPEAMPARRLGLPTPPDYHLGDNESPPTRGIYHFGHTADPVYTGTCNTFSSTCTVAGYALESLCHLGSICTYDTVSDLGWRSDMRNHKLATVIHNVLEIYNTTAQCEPVGECFDCSNWKFYRSNGTESTTRISTSTTSKYSQTRTQTCQTPGWWGCLDESTTTKGTVTSTSTLTTTSCKTPGWFGCKDEKTMTITTTITSSISAPTITTPPILTTPPSTISSIISSATTCTSKAWFGLICVDPSPTKSTSMHSSVVPTSSTSSSTCTVPSPTHCVERRWYGACKSWSC